MTRIMTFGIDAKVNSHTVPSKLNRNTIAGLPKWFWGNSVAKMKEREKNQKSFMKKMELFISVWNYRWEICRIEFQIVWKNKKVKCPYLLSFEHSGIREIFTARESVEQSKQLPHKPYPIVFNTKPFLVYCSTMEILTPCCQLSILTKTYLRESSRTATSNSNGKRKWSMRMR